MNYKKMYRQLYHEFNHWYFRNYYVIVFWFWWIVAALVLGLSGYGAYWVTTNYVEADAKVKMAEARVDKAEADTQELHDVLKGKLSMVDWDGVSKYAVIERVTWEVRK